MTPYHVRQPSRPDLAYFDSFVVNQGTCADVGNACPVVWAGPPQVAECTAGVGTSTVFGLAGDPDGDPVSLYWTNGATTQATSVTFGLGTHALSLVASDGKCAASDSTNVTVVDTLPPVITCAAPIETQCQGGVGLSQPGPAQAHDGCDGPVPVVTNGGASYPLGTTTITWAAFDQAGHGAACDTSVTVIDTRPPQVTCPGPRTVECQSPALSLGKAVDSCDGPIAVARLGPFTYPLGESVETYVGVDASGNYASCNAQVTAVDTLAPQLTCPPLLTFECAKPAIPPAVSAIDACDAAPVVTHVVTIPAQPGQGSVTYTATDAGGHSVSCSAPVQVVDSTPPVIACPGPAQIECGSKVVPVATAQDTCDPQPKLSSTPIGVQPGAQVVTWTAIDHAAQQSSCQSLVTVVDSQAPVLTCPPAQKVECGGPGMTPVLATDACQGPVTATPEGSQTSQPGSHTVTYTAVDASGHVATCTTTQTVVDSNAPVLTCPASQVVECGGKGLPGATALDACQGPLPVQGQAPATSKPGKTTVTYTAKDAAGNLGTCTATQTVVDTNPPQIQCPAAVQVECGQKVPALQAQASDTCGVAKVTDDRPKQWPLGQTLVHFQAVDQAGLKASCTTPVQVQDTDGPVVATVDYDAMWPPNHKMQTITLDDCCVHIQDKCQGELSLEQAKGHITCVTSDEPENDVGDGNADPDIVIVNATTVQLRRERQGPKDGRVYRIGFEVQDAAGNVSVGTCLVPVPHDQNKPAVDSGVKVQVCKK